MEVMKFKIQNLKHLFFFVILNLGCFAIKGQTLPDSIIILKITYINNGWSDTAYAESIYQVKKTNFTKSFNFYESNENSINISVVSDLLKELKNPDNFKNGLSRYQIDTNWVKNHIDKLIKRSPYAKRYFWNEKQRTFIKTSLTNSKNYELGLHNYLNNGCCYTMHNNYSYQLKIKFYLKGQIMNEITSRKYLWGFQFPWVDINNNKLYSFKIEQIIDRLLNYDRKIEEPLKGKPLLRLLVDNIFQASSDSLYKLAPYSFLTQINEFKPTFTIKSFSELSSYGGYYGDGPLIQVVLNNAEMLPNLNIEWLASIKNNALYPRDSIIRSYKKLIDRIQSIGYITTYLKDNPSDELNILFFDFKSINTYNTKIINGNPADWKLFDRDVENFKWYDKSNIKPSFDINEALKTSRQLYCGCGFKFSKEFIEQGILFNIDDKNGNHTRWVLLPDNTILLYMMEGEKALNYDYTRFGNQPGFRNPCVRFDFNGNKIKSN